ncbi:MAG: Dabb family protein [Maribacter sp.]|nr:Dabb family protein [Maribacter sp.]
MHLFNVGIKQSEQPMKSNIENVKDSVLRHVVLFKFKTGTGITDIEKVEDAFSKLPSKIPEIMAYEWGTNNSPEGLEKGFTHCFFLTFKSEEDRAVYLPHPDHKAFGQILTPYLDDVLVIDYWTE